VPDVVSGDLWKRDPKANWRNPGYEPSDDQPVVCVSWNDAKAFCDWLSQREGRQYALPTEAQWEYACRAGSGTRFFFGDDERELAKYAWYHHDDSELKPHAVGKKKPNAWGLFDMHGNVWQWTADWYGGDFYQSSPKNDPPGPSAGSTRVQRGGSWASGWSHPVNYCRDAFRDCRWAPSVCYSDIGFRVVLLADQDKVHFSSVPAKSVLAAVAPFVVVGKKERPERACMSLQNAVDSAQGGDTIEIRGDGPIGTAPAVISKALTLRAGEGQWPILVHKTSGSLLRATAPLVVEGLEFHGDLHKEEGETFIETSGAPLRITHCHIMVRGKNAIWAHASPLFEVQDSEVIARNWGAINWDVTDKGKLVVKNCAGVAWGAVWLHHYPPADDVEVELTANTFFSSCFCGHRFYQDPVGIGPKKDNPCVRIKATQNVVRSAQYLCLLEYGDKDRAFESGVLADWYRDHVSWNGTDNLVAVHEGGNFLMIRQFDPAKGGARHCDTFKEWKDFWKSETVPWIEGTPRFAGGDLLQRVLWEDMENITPAEFRLKADSPGKDLGAKVIRIGPGQAYESWKKMPEYEVWRKKTDELMGRP
jgi:hypothetical protein